MKDKQILSDFVCDQVTDTEEYVILPPYSMETSTDDPEMTEQTFGGCPLTEQIRRDGDYA